jgi:hypothetical protein
VIDGVAVEELLEVLAEVLAEVLIGDFGVR